MPSLYIDYSLYFSIYCHSYMRKCHKVVKKNHIMLYIINVPLPEWKCSVAFPQLGVATVGVETASD